MFMNDSVPGRAERVQSRTLSRLRRLQKTNSPHSAVMQRTKLSLNHKFDRQLTTKITNFFETIFT